MRKLLATGKAALAMTVAFLFVAGGGLVGSSGEVLENIEIKLVVPDDSAALGKCDAVEYGEDMIYVEKEARLTNKDISKISARKVGPESGGLAIDIEFNSEGKSKLHRFTKEFERGSFAIFVNGEVVSLAVISEEVFSGKMTITGKRGEERVLEDLAMKIGLETDGDSYADEFDRVNRQFEKRLKETLNRLSEYFEKQRKIFRHDPGRNPDPDINLD